MMDASMACNFAAQPPSSLHFQQRYELTSSGTPVKVRGAISSEGGGEKREAGETMGGCADR